MGILPIVIGCGVLLMTGRAVVLGGASSDGQSITREDEPLAYWFCIVAGIAIAAILFFIGLRGSGG
jgi:hypothetical protein